MSNSTTYKYLTVFCLCIGINQTKAQNISKLSYKQTEIIKVENIKNDAQIYSLTVDNKTTIREFSDGLGRKVQQVAKEGNPLKKDIILPIAYDQFGRQTKAYLPYISNSSTGDYENSALANQLSFYSNGVSDKVADDIKPFSVQEFENSPLQRLLKTGDVGEGFQTNQHFKSLNYRSNVNEDEVRLWKQDGTSISSYSEASLFVTEYLDENNIKTILFKDKSDRLILKRIQADVTIDGLLEPFFDTYYIYDDLGNIKYLVTPKATSQMKKVNSWVLNTTIIDELVYSYVYDVKGRLVERKVPGSAPIYIIYDSLDRPLLVQDGNLRLQNKWYYRKYDSKQRIASEGIYSNTMNTTRASLQSFVDGINFNSIYFEERLAGNTGYTNQVFPVNNIPQSALEEYCYYYYDDYDFNFDGVKDYTYKSQGLANEAVPSDRTRGFLTAVKRKILNTSTWLLTVNFYDKKGNVIQVLSNNQLNTALEDTKTRVVDFIGRVKIVKEVKKVSPAQITTVQTAYAYDHDSRLLTIDQSVNGGASLKIASYEYNALGQLVDKKLHSNNGSTFLQSVDYRYNIRGKLISINNSSLTSDIGTTNTNDETNDVFGMEILYDKTDASLGNVGLFNGNISATKWKVKVDPVDISNVNSDERGYKFTYDKANRLINANYSAKNGALWNKDNGGFDERNIEYDQNGNILKLERTGIINNAVSIIDKLTYTYSNNGNKLFNIEEEGDVAIGFLNKTVGDTQEYFHDINGNLITDNNKKVAITYNNLNKTEKISIIDQPNRYIQFTYDTKGIRIKKEVVENNITVATYNYIDGFVYEGASNNLSYFSMPEGRVRNTGGASVSLKYEYFLTDHLGNVRVSFEEGSTAGSVRVRQETSYYPFGMVMPGTPQVSGENKHLFNAGSEWQNDFDELPDYSSTFFREYDAAIGRFIAIDPKAEATHSWSTYQFAYNNPIVYNDPLGDVPGGEDIDHTYDNPAMYERIGPGSGNHWSDFTRTEDGNLMLMSQVTFNIFYNIQSDYHIETVTYDGKLVATNIVKDWKKSEAGGNANSGGVKEYFDAHNGDISNYLTGIGYVTGAGANWAGNIIKSRSLYGLPSATTILRTPIANIHVPTGALRTTGTALKTLGNAAGVASLGITGYQYLNGQITGKEASVDAAFGVIGFMGPVGAGVSILYFGGKFAYEYYSGDTLFDKPKQ